MATYQRIPCQGMGFASAAGSGVEEHRSSRIGNWNSAGVTL
jgi:hypothetical protein